MSMLEQKTLYDIADLNFGLKSKNIMLMEIVAYFLIAFQIPLVLCRPHSQNFNGSNPYYDSYGQNQYWGNNGNLNSYPTTQKSLYPTLYPQNTTPQPYYAKGQYTPNPHSNYFNRNSTFQNPSNTYGNNNFSSSGWNNNFNPYTTPPSIQQPYGQFGTATLKPPAATLPPFSPTGSFNRYNQTNPTYPASNHHYNSNPTNPTTSNYRPRPSFPNNPTYPASNSTSPSYPSNHYNNNPTNPPYRLQNTLPPYTPSPNPSSNYRPQTSFTNNPTYPASNRTSPTYPSNHHYNSSHTNPTKTNNFQNYDRNNNRYNPQYRPSAPSVMPSQPTYDPHGTPLAPFATYHANKPINDNLFNYDNLHRRQPDYKNGMQSGQFEQLNQVPLAPFPGQRAPTYDSISNVPLAPFPG